MDMNLVTQTLPADLMPWLTENPLGEFCFTALVSMIPVVELRGGIPFGVARGLPVWAACVPVFEL